MCHRESSVRMCLILLALMMMTTVDCRRCGSGKDTSSYVPSEGRKYFTAAVYEYVARGDTLDGITVQKHIEKNLKVFENAASLASIHNADILAFPEYGIIPRIREKIFHDVPYVPDPKTTDWNPCTEPDRFADSYVLANLSCMAQKYKVVMVANILSKVPCTTATDRKCPSDGVYMYNTNVAFDRSGFLVARYRKTYLYFEDNIETPSEFEYSYFDTDFGRVGTFTSFDVVYKEVTTLVEKYSIDIAVSSEMWFEYLAPGMNSLQLAQSWSIRNDVAFLTSNRQLPATGSLGSSIFFGKTGIGNYVYESDGQSRLLISKVPRRGVNPEEIDYTPTLIEIKDYPPTPNVNNISSGVCSKSILGEPADDQDFRCFDFDLSNFTLIKLKQSEERISACQNGLCCSVEYKARLRGESYYLAVFNGLYTVFNRHTWWLEACFIVRCESFNGKECSTFPTKSNTLFTELKMRANFHTKYVYPSVLGSGMQLIRRNKWSFTDNGLSLQTLEDKLLFASLYGRNYGKDPEIEKKN